MIVDFPNVKHTVNFLNVKRTALFNSISETFDEFIHFNNTENVIFVMKHRQRQLSKFTWEVYSLRRNLLYH